MADAETWRHCRRCDVQWRAAGAWAKCWVCARFGARNRGPIVAQSHVLPDHRYAA